jgi:tRNA dimethylallyltransferase
VESTPVVAIVGPTASGKSGLALRSAADHEGEIICADSRTIYKDMDIGTAKPTADDRKKVPHHLLDILEPGVSYSAADFKSDALRSIGTISRRQKIPFIVGGTGLYVYGLLYDYRFPAGETNVNRAKYEALTITELVAELKREDPEIATQIDLKNPRRVIRALETVGQPRQKATALKSNILLIGLNPETEQLNTQIAQRTKAMIQMGLIDEVQKLVQTYGQNSEAFRSPGYAEIIDFLADRTTISEAEALINMHTRQLVRRQLTWFRRNPEIQWYENADVAADRVTSFLSRA